VEQDERDGTTIVTARCLVSPELADEWGRSLNESPRLGTKGSVLVVESEPSHAVRVLERAGYDVQPVDDGVTASQWLASSSFDAVITDASPKGCTGIELLRFSREHHPGLPILLMTGARDFDLAQQAVEHGAFQFLLTPIPEERLIAAVARAVTERKRHAHAEVMALLDEVPTVVTASAEQHMRFNRLLQSLWMAYQPIVATDGTLFAYEALVRSDEPGLMGAGDILDMAERLNRLTDLGRVVRSRAGRLLTENGGDFSLFVNLHSSDLMDETLTAHNAPLARIASNVVLEITERAAVHDAVEARARMAELRAMGYRIALDDLGAGYAGLTSFAELQPEIVKIDMGLVRGIDVDPVRRKLVGSVVRLSRELGITVVGEGVETVDERDVLIDLGCDLLQGYLFGKPERR
jgi:EAL domain-containing protein (putative c-di-GMP-specific phosphodiesterase class I)